MTNKAQGIQTKTKTDENGVYTFPSLPVGRYDLHFEAQGFKPQDKTGLKIDIDSALTEDTMLELAGPEAARIRRKASRLMRE